MVTLQRSTLKEVEQCGRNTKHRVDVWACGDLEGPVYMQPKP